MSTSRRSREPSTRRSTPTRPPRKAGTAAANATWFDLLTAAAFLIFRDAAVEWAVIEVGLGGRLNSTNVVDGEIAVVTNIALEHTEILGHTRAAIAGEKVGILKPGAVLVTTLDADDEAGRVLQTRADELGSRVKRTRLDASAPIEQINLALAAAVLGELAPQGGERALRGAGRRGAPRRRYARRRASPRAHGALRRRNRAEDACPSSWTARMCRSTSGPCCAISRSTPDLSGPCVAIVALAADKDAEGFVAELARTRLDHRLHRCAGIEPGPLAGRVEGARRVRSGSRARSSRTQSER